jgi:hypothetical protein
VPMRAPLHMMKAIIRSGGGEWRAGEKLSFSVLERPGG